MWNHWTHWQNKHKHTSRKDATNTIHHPHPCRLSWNTISYTQAIICRVAECVEYMVMLAPFVPSSVRVLAVTLLKFSCVDSHHPVFAVLEPPVHTYWKLNGMHTCITTDSFHNIEVEQHKHWRRQHRHWPNDAIAPNDVTLAKNGSIKKC